MKKFLVLCMMLVLAAGVLAGCGNDAAKKDEGGKIVVGLDDNFPPMGFKDENNEIVGFDIDLAKEAAKRNIYFYAFTLVNWKDIGIVTKFDSLHFLRNNGS